MAERTEEQGKEKSKYPVISYPRRFNAALLDPHDNAIFDIEGRAWVNPGVSQKRVEMIADLVAGSYEHGTNYRLNCPRHRYFN